MTQIDNSNNEETVDNANKGRLGNESYPKGPLVKEINELSRIFESIIDRYSKRILEEMDEDEKKDVINEGMEKEESLEESTINKKRNRNEEFISNTKDDLMVFNNTLDQMEMILKNNIRALEPSNVNSKKN